MTHSEAADQISVIQWSLWASKQRPELELLYHVANGGKRSKAEAGRFKAMGVKPGVPDLVLPVARGKYHGLYIELKATGGRATDNQTQWIDRLRKQGYAAVICIGAEAAISAISRYLHGDDI